MPPGVLPSIIRRHTVAILATERLSLRGGLEQRVSDPLILHRIETRGLVVTGRGATCHHQRRLRSADKSALRPQHRHARPWTTATIGKGICGGKTGIRDQKRSQGCFRGRLAPSGGRESDRFGGMPSAGSAVRSGVAASGYEMTCGVFNARPVEPPRGSIRSRDQSRRTGFQHASNSRHAAFVVRHLRPVDGPIPRQDLLMAAQSLRPSLTRRVAGPVTRRVSKGPSVSEAYRQNAPDPASQRPSLPQAAERRSPR